MSFYVGNGHGPVKDQRLDPPEPKTPRCCLHCPDRYECEGNDIEECMDADEAALDLYNDSKEHDLRDNGLI